MMNNDRTCKIEEKIEQESQPKLFHLLRLWKMVFCSTKLISCIYLGTYILLSVLRPILALIWGKYISTVQAGNLEDTILPSLILLLSYFAINYIVDIIGRYVVPREEIERLDVVQANYQQELFQSKMYKKLASISPEYMEVPKVNDTIEQIFSFVGQSWGGMNQKVMMQSYVIIAKIVSVISIAFSLSIFDPWLCIIILVAPLPSVWFLFLGQKLQFRFIKENTKLTRKAKYFQDLMLSTGGKELKTLGLYDFIYRKWKAVSDEYTVREKKVIRIQTILKMMNFFLVCLINVGSTIFAIVLFSMGKISLGALGAVMSLVSTLVDDTRELLSGIVAFLSKKNEAAQFYDLMDLPAQGNSGTGCECFEDIQARNIKYRYPLTQRYALNGINLYIRKGEKVAFVGENGMGKSTFVKLLTGMITPSEGEMLFNNASVEEIDPVIYYDKLSVVVQNPSRYETFTMGDNVYLGDAAKPRNEKDMKEAFDFVKLCSEDEDKLLGKDVDGVDLSGGQWQKLAIARAVYRGRDFIILDEPTSNLDPLVEAEIFQKYIELARDKTVIFVTHRISIAALADRIVVFADGKIAEDGKHDELIQASGEYARLYREQAKWYDR